jgi:hypothetical protein
MVRKICSAILLVALLGLAGCPDETVQKGGGDSAEESKGGE